MTKKNSSRDPNGRKDSALSRRTALKRIAAVSGIGAAAAAAAALVNKAEAAYLSSGGGTSSYSAYISWSYSSR